MVLFLDGSGVEGQPPMAGAAAVRVKGVGQVTESVVKKMVYGAASLGEVQAVADVVGKIGEEVRGSVDGGGRGGGHCVPQETSQEATA